MLVNFDELRSQLIDAFNNLSMELTRHTSMVATDTGAVERVVTVKASVLLESMDSLRGLICSLASCYSSEPEIINKIPSFSMQVFREEAV